MASIPPHVQPGQLILADHWNAMIDVLTELKAIVDSLGAGGVVNGPPVIVAIQPDNQAPIGSEITLIGSGFGIDVENSVTIANISAAVLGGGNGQLKVRVPIIQGLPAAGLQTQITVSNPRGFTSAPFRVMPAVLSLPEGQLFVNMTSSPTGTIQPGSTADFQFTIRAVVNLSETYELTPLLSPSASPAAWGAEVFDAAGTPLKVITIPAGSPPDGEVRQVRVRVTIPPNSNGATAGLSLTVRSQRNTALVASSPTFTITVGSAAPAPEVLTIVRAPGVVNGTVDPDGTIVARTSTTRVTFSVTGVKPNLRYNISLGTVPSTWFAQVVGGAAQTPSSTQLTFSVDFRPLSNASAVTFNMRVSQADDEKVFGTLALPVRPQ